MYQSHIKESEREMIYKEIEQGSESWLQIRKGKVTVASFNMALANV